jgi:hypothetical protein
LILFLHRKKAKKGSFVCLKSYWDEHYLNGSSTVSTFCLLCVLCRTFHLFIFRLCFRTDYFQLASNRLK